MFSVQECHNSQNVRIYALRLEDIPEHLRTVQRFQYETKQMIWAGISKRGKLPLVFIEPGVKVNAKYYRQHLLEKVLKPDGDKLHD